MKGIGKNQGDILCYSSLWFLKLSLCFSYNLVDNNVSVNLKIRLQGSKKLKSYLKSFIVCTYDYFIHLYLR